ERSVDLERVDRQLVQVTQRRVAGPEIVQVDFHAEVAKLAEQLRGRVRAVHQRGLRDFEAKVARLQSGVMNRLLDEREEILLRELPAGNVDGDAVEATGRKASLPVRE